MIASKKLVIPGIPALAAAFAAALLLASPFAHAAEELLVLKLSAKDGTRKGSPS